MSRPRWVLATVLLLLGSTFAGPVVLGQAAPTITTITPAQGDDSGGTVVTIEGTNFLPSMSASDVTFDGTPVQQLTYVSNTEIEVVAPARTISTSTPVDVTVANGAGTATASPGYTYEPTELTFSTPDPSQAPEGWPRTVNITGSGFQDTASNPLQVHFGAVEGVVESVQSSLIRVETPGVAGDETGGVVDVTVTNGGTSSVAVRRLDAFEFTAGSDPQINSLSTTAGPSSGGTSVWIDGEDFDPNVEVRFGGEPGQVQAVPDPQTIHVTTPPHAAGTVDVVVANPDATATQSNGFTFSTTPAPTVGSATPDHGPVEGGTSVTISGSDFQSGATVAVGGRPASNVNVPSSNQITADTPPGTKGAADVTVTNPDGQSGTLSGGFTYTETTVYVGSISPASDTTNGGATVTLTGEGFDAAAGTVDRVLFGGRPGTNLDVQSDTQLTVDAPPRPHAAAGPVPVTVVRSDRQSHTVAPGFTYSQAAAPTVSSLSPDHGPSAGWLAQELGQGPEEQVTFSGENLHHRPGTPPGDDTVVLFGGAKAEVASGNNLGNSDPADDQLVVVPPPHLPARSKVPVVVQNPDGQRDRLTNAYRYTLSGALPEVTQISPTSGPTAGGTTVTITGSEFTPNARVLFGGRKATVLSQTSSQIDVEAPTAETTGPVTVRVVNDDGETATSPTDYTYQQPGLAVTGFQPMVGSATTPTQVQINGSGFTPDVEVDFGSQPAVAVLSVDHTEIQALAPTQTKGTSVQITVTVPSSGDTVTTTGTFKYTQLGLVPEITAVTDDPNHPGTTNGGETVVVEGDGFHPNADVTFDGTSAQHVAHAGPNRLVVTTPPRTSAGDVAVTVANPSDRSDTLDPGYTYASASAPAITSTSREVGPDDGGTPIVIEGSNFAPRANSGASGVPDPVQGIHVEFSDSTQTKSSPRILSATADRIVAVTPSWTIPGGQSQLAVDVEVTNPDGQSATETDGFTYTDTGTQPRIDSLQPTQGSTNGGTPVTIDGQDFAPTVQVTFGGTAAQQVAYLGPTRIVASTPSQTTGGSVDVEVTNPTPAPAPDESSKAVGAFTYTAASSPTINDVQPDHGSEQGGTVVEITGSGFAQQAKVGTVEPIDGVDVTFGGNDAVAILSAFPNRIRAIAPPCSGCGDVDVTVTNPDGASDTASDAFSYTPTGLEPDVVRVLPEEGTTNGGDVVTIVGLEFAPGASVTFDGVPAQHVAFLGPSVLEVVTPPASLGSSVSQKAVDVTVTNTNGASDTAQDGFIYRKAAAPTISSITRDSGPESGGIPVEIEGTGFAPQATAPGQEPVEGVEVRFGGTVSSSVLSASETRIIAVVPGGSIPPSDAEAAVDVVIENPDGQSVTETDGFTYTKSDAGLDPEISQVAPAKADTNGGVRRTIEGRDFHPQATVEFGSTQTTDVVYLGPGELNVTVPVRSSAGGVTLTVTNPAGPSATTPFTYEDASDPTIASVTRDSGPQAGGTPVRIDGSNFHADASVTFGGQAALAARVVDSTTIAAVSPACSGCSDVQIQVTNPEGTSAQATFTYTTTGLDPEVTGVTPTQGSENGGQVVTVEGEDFAPDAQVTFGGKAPQHVAYGGPTTLEVVPPPCDGCGDVDVQVTNPQSSTSDTLADGYTYNAAPSPSITGVSPDSGSTLGGTPVTITGTDFAAPQAKAPAGEPVEGVEVRFGGTDAAAILSVTASEIRAIAPQHAAGLVDVVVENPDGDQGTATDAYTYTTTGLSPTVSSFDPTTLDTNGGTLQIRGSEFTPTATVRFGVGGSTTKTADAHLVAPDTLEVQAPTWPSAQTIDVVVENADGGSSPEASFTYTASAAPSISSLAPANGLTSGRTPVTITGSNFHPDVAVTFDNQAAVHVDRKGPGQIQAVAPEHATAETVDVTVENPDGGTDTDQDAYRYTTGGRPSGYHAQLHFTPSLDRIQGEETFVLSDENTVEVEATLHHADGSTKEFVTGSAPRARLVLAAKGAPNGHVYTNTTEVTGEEHVATFTLLADDLVAHPAASAWTLRVESPNDAVERQGQTVPAHAYYNADANATFANAPAEADRRDAAPTPVLVPALPAESLAFVQTPPTVEAGSAFTVRLELRDRDGRRAAASQERVDIAVDSGPQGLGGTTHDQADQGLAVLDTLKLTRTGDYTLRAEAGGVAPLGREIQAPMTATSPTIHVDPAAPAEIRWIDVPGTVQSGDSFTVRAEVLDPYGNRVDDDLKLTLSAGSASWTAQTGTSGVATFPGVVLDDLGDHTLELSATGLPTISRTVHVNPADPIRLDIQQDDLAQDAGDTQAVTYTVRRFDDNGNELDVDSAEDVNWFLSDSTAGSFEANVLHPSDDAGTYTVTAALKDDASVEDQTTFTIRAGDLVSLGVTCTPDPVRVNGSVDCQAHGQDAHGNPVDADDEVTWNANSSGPTVEIDGNGTFRAPQDVDHSPVQVRANTSSLNGTDTVTVEAGPPAALRIETRATGDGTSVGSDSLQIGDTGSYHAVHRDAFTNFVGSVSATWSLTGDDVGSLDTTSGASVTLTADADGQATLQATDDAGRTASADLTVTDPTAPSPISNLTSSTHPKDTWTAARTVQITWSAAQDNGAVDGYSYVFTRSGQTPDAISETSDTQAQVQAQADGVYAFRIRAIDDDGNAGPIAVYGPVRIDTEAPNAPSNLTATPKAGGAVEIEWIAARDAGSGVDVHVVERAEPNGTFQELARVDGTAYTDPGDGTEDGATYRYRVHAEDTLGHAGPLVETSATVDHGEDYRIADPDTAKAIAKALGLAESPDTLRALDEDRDGSFDLFAGQTEIAIDRTARIDGTPALLLGRTGEPPRAIWLTGEDQVEVLDPVNGSVSTVEDRSDGTVASVQVQNKTGWILVGSDDPVPDRDLVEVRTDDGRTIPLEQVWREDGRVEFLDDPTTTYELVYAQPAPDGGLPAWVLGTIAVAAIVGVAGAFVLLRRERW